MSNGAPFEKADFLSALRKRNFSSDSDYSLMNPMHLRVQISLLPEGNVTLRIVDKSGHTQDASLYAHVGEIGPLLRTLSELRSDNAMGFSWSNTSSEFIYLFADFPFIASFLPGCKHLLVDENMNSLALDEQERSVSFQISHLSDDLEDDRYQGKFFAGDSPVVAFITGEWALCEGAVVAIKDIGARFSEATAFCDIFRYDMAESFLSIFFSNMKNVDLDFQGRKMVVIDEPVEPSPILIFEKVDSDNSLILRVSESVGNLPAEICEDFALSVFVSLTDQEIYIRHMGPDSIQSSLEIVIESIRSNISRSRYKNVWVEGNRIIIPHDIASSFLYNSFASLLPMFRIMGAEKLKAYKIVAGMPKLNMKLGSGIDFLEGKATVELAGEKFTISDLLKQYTKQRYVTLSDGNRAVMDSTYMRRLGRIFRSGSSDGENVKISFFDLPDVMQLLENAGQEAKAPEVYRKFYEGFNNLHGKRVTSPKLKAKLRSYQKQGLNWINYLYNSRIGGCLADDMGLGKTVQTIAMLCHSVIKAEKPAIIIMPPSLIFNWQEEFKKFAPHIKIASYYGTSRNLQEAMKAQVILTSYPLVRNDIEEFMKQEFDYIILDESQNIKNTEAQVTKAVWLLKGEHRLAISGTPIENNLAELYSLFRFLNPTMFGTLQEFSNMYIGPIQREGDSDVSRALRRKVYPFILRRLKKDVLTDLPERTEQVLTVEMSPAQAKLYEERRSHFAAKVAEARAAHGLSSASFEMLQALSELRQIASVPETKSDGTISSPKLEVLMETLLNAVGNGHKVVVFFNFLAGIELTAEQLNRHKIGYETMTGSTRDRQKVVDNFQNNPDCKVMLMTVKTGGVGLNLTAADTVFVVESWWNKAAEEQAINRLHRIGQKNCVTCYFLITADTIEQKIRELQEKKSALVDAIISSDSAGKSLSAEDIAYLLS